MCVKVPVWYQKRVRMLCIRFHVIVVVLYHCRILCILHNHVNTQERASAIYSLGLISLHKQRRTQRSSPSLFLLLLGAIEHRSNTRVRRARRAGGERARGREGERVACAGKQGSPVFPAGERGALQPARSARMHRRRRRRRERRAPCGPSQRENGAAAVRRRPGRRAQAQAQGPRATGQGPGARGNGRLG